MGQVDKIVVRLSKAGVVAGGIFLIAIMGLTVGNVIYRFFGRTILGNYELTELMIVVVVGFALVYAALRQRHIVMRMFVSRLSQRAQTITEIIASMLGAAMLGLLAWVTVSLMLGRGFVGEGTTDLIGIPIFPVKCIWAFALLLFFLIFVIDFLKSIRQLTRK